MTASTTMAEFFSASGNLILTTQRADKRQGKPDAHIAMFIYERGIAEFDGEVWKFILLNTQTTEEF